MNKHNETDLRQQLLRGMLGDQSHITFDDAIEGFPVSRAGEKPPGAPHSAWQLLEHMRLAQNDILEFSRNPKHQSPKWPEGYWPKQAAPPNEKAWASTVAAFKEDRKAMDELIRSEAHDLYAKIEGGDGQTLLREAIVLGSHNSYHLGQLMFLKKMFEAEKR